MDTNKQKYIKKIASISQNKARKIKYKCLFPSCKEESIKSHSLQRNYTLERIAQKGKVIGLEIDTTTYETYLKNEASFRLIGIKDASVFDGFCSYHDHQLFLKLKMVVIFPILYFTIYCCIFVHSHVYTHINEILQNCLR